MTNIKQIMQENPDGFTVDVGTMELITQGVTRGFIVGITNITTTDGMLESAFNTALNIASKISARATVGGWKAPDGKLFLDVGVLVPTSDDAHRLKTLFNQQAVFNLDTWQSE